MPLRINHEVIDDAVLEQEFSTIKTQFERMGGVSCCERDDEFRDMARDQVITRTLLGQQAEASQPDPSAEDVEAALKSMHEAHGGEQAFWFHMGVGPEQADLVKDRIRHSLKVDALVAEIGGDLEDPGDEILQAFHDDHRDHYRSREEVRASHILKSFARIEDRNGLFASLCEARRRILSGEDFDAVAREITDKPHDEIDLGWFGAGDLMEEFEWICLSMEVGEVSPVFASSRTFHLAQVTDRRPARLQPLEEVRGQVLADWQETTREDRVMARVSEWRQHAEIEDLDSEEGEAPEITPAP